MRCPAEAVLSVAEGVSASHVEQVMRKTADAVTQCKFESTDPASDDAVLYKILQASLIGKDGHPVRPAGSRQHYLYTQQ